MIVFWNYDLKKICKIVIRQKNNELASPLLFILIKYWLVNGKGEEMFPSPTAIYIVDDHMLLWRLTSHHVFIFNFLSHPWRRGWRLLVSRLSSSKLSTPNAEEEEEPFLREFPTVPLQRLLKSSQVFFLSGSLSLIQALAEQLWFIWGHYLFAS